MKRAEKSKGQSIPKADQEVDQDIQKRKEVRQKGKKSQTLKRSRVS